MNGRFVRLGETARANVSIVIDGHSVEALEGDTLLTAMLCSVRHVRRRVRHGGRDKVVREVQRC